MGDLIGCQGPFETPIQSESLPLVGAACSDLIGIEGGFLTTVGDGS